MWLWTSGCHSATSLQNPGKLRIEEERYLQVNYFSSINLEFLPISQAHLEYNINPIIIIPPYPWGFFVPIPQWMPEIMDSTELYIYCVFSYTKISMIKFNL